MGILEHVADREIRGDVAGYQRSEGNRDEPELRNCHRLGDRHQRGIAGTGADQRNGRLDQRQCQRKHESVMADLYDH